MRKPIRATDEKAKVVTAKRGKSDRETELERRVRELEQENARLKGVDAPKSAHVASGANRKGTKKL